MYGNTYPSYLDKLTVLNNKLLRILQRKGRTCCKESLYLQYNTLPPVQLFNYQVLNLVHKTVFSTYLLPSIFQNYYIPTKSIHGYETRHNKLYLTHINTRFGQRILRYKGTHEAVRVAVGLRLGLDLCVPHECHCGSRVDAYGAVSYTHLTLPTIYSV